MFAQMALCLYVNVFSNASSWISRALSVRSHLSGKKYKRSARVFKIKFLWRQYNTCTIVIHLHCSHGTGNLLYLFHSFRSFVPHAFQNIFLCVPCNFSLFRLWFAYPVILYFFWMYYKKILILLLMVFFSYFLFIE